MSGLWFLTWSHLRRNPGRSAILAYTMPIWATMIAAVLLHEPLSRRKLLGLALGISGMAVLIGEQISAVRAAPFGALMILAAAIVWALGTVLLRKWQPAIPQNTLSGWMMLLGWIPIALLAPLFDPQPLSTELANLSARGWFAGSTIRLKPDAGAVTPYSGARFAST